MARRNELAKRVGMVKETISLPLEDKSVEARLVDQVMKECDRAGVDRGVGLKVLNALVAEGKRVQGGGAA